MTTTKIDIQIRFADIDMLRHVNNINLQHYFDLGKSDFFEKVVNADVVWGKMGLITANTVTSYIEQTRYNDKIYVETACEAIGNKSITVRQRIINYATEKIHAESHTVLVCFDFEAQQTELIPNDWRVKLENSME